jgi:predicted RNA methylase
MFDLSRAISARQEHYWFKLFDLCSFTNILPSELWNKWRDSFTAWREKKGAGIPLFDRTTVYSCLSLVESHRANFFSMRVDAVWKALSGWHKTNWGGAFHDRFIIDWMFNEHGTCTDKDRSFYDLINLCTTIITGAEDPFFNSYGVLRDARQHHCGEWVELLNGVLRIKAFKRGTLHCEIHPEIANKLNVALAYLHPNSLPDEATLKRPRRKTGFGSAQLVVTQIPRQVRSYLSECRQEQREDGLWVLKRCSSAHLFDRLSGAIKNMIDEALAQVGAVREGNIHLFDYPPIEVISEIIRTGEVPEKVSHQYYSTPTELAQEFIKWVDVEDSDICYETSAGTGGIAKHMPLQTYCVEVDRLRAIALDRMGFEVKNSDFLSLVPSDLYGEADVVLMNPPFAGRAWQDHFEHAVQFVKAGGLIGAILPEGAPLKMPAIQGLEVVYSEPMRNRFPDASISVVFAKWVKPAIQVVESKPEEINVNNVGFKARPEVQMGLFEAA